MALFSQRFWLRLAALDSQVATSQKALRGARTRLLIGRSLVTGAGLVECWTEFRQEVAVAQRALDQLNDFCTGRTLAARRHQDEPASEQEFLSLP